MFEIFTSYVFIVVAIGCLILGLLSGVLGSIAVLNKQALIGDGMSHAALPGIVISFMIVGNKDIFTMMIGALVSAILSVYLVSICVKYTKLSFDTSLAVMLSVFFGFGLVLKTLVQKQNNSGIAGIDSFIYGQASTLLRSDVYTIAIVSITCILILLIFFKPIKIAMFDKVFAKSIGINVALIDIVLTVLIALSIIVGIQSVGVVLMSAMLIAPAVAARQWTNKFGVMIVLSAFFGALSALLGTVISSLINSMPTGATIVLVVSAISILSLLLAPKRGIVYRALLRARLKKEIMEGRHESNT